MRRAVVPAILGAAAGALSAFSHGVAGGAVGLAPLIAIVSVSAVVFAGLPRRLRGTVGVVSVLIVLQIAAHLWLEMVHPHAHGPAHGHGLAGAIQHALTPGMLMMWAHLLAIVVGAVVVLLCRRLLETLLDHVASWFAPLVVSAFPSEATERPWFFPRDFRPRLLAHVIEGRGPPLVA